MSEISIVYITEDKKNFSEKGKNAAAKEWIKDAGKNPWSKWQQGVFIILRRISRLYSSIHSYIFQPLTIGSMNRTVLVGDKMAWRELVCQKSQMNSRVLCRIIKCNDLAKKLDKLDLFQNYERFQWFKR